MPVFKVSKGKLILILAAAAKSLQSCLTLRNPIDGSPPGSSVPGILQARILEWVAISFSRGSFWPRNRNLVSCIGDRFFTDWAMRQALYNSGWKKEKKESDVAQSCPTLCNTVDCSLPRSSVHGIFQARVLEWVAISFSNGGWSPMQMGWSQ